MANIELVCMWKSVRYFQCKGGWITLRVIQPVVQHLGASLDGDGPRMLELPI
jgi:hypothetical protein